MMNFLHRILIFVCLFFVVGLLFAYASVYVNPQSFSFFALFGLAYPYLLIVNVIFLFYWVYRKRWSFLLPLIAILLGWQIFTTFVSLGFSRHKLVDKDISLLSYNVRYFNRYDWNKDPNVAIKILKMIKIEDPDIICLQEFLLDDTDVVSLASIKKSLSDYRYSYVNNGRSLAIFSKFLITNTEDIAFEKPNTASAFFADVKIGDDSVRIFNCHLESNRFSRKDYEFINNLSQNAEDKNINGAMGITKRLTYAFKKRGTQALLINDLLKISPFKTIACMDMNDTPVSYVYKSLSSNLKDSFLEKGLGVGTTYIGDFPSYRIDYVFHHRDIECVSYKILKLKYSDHYPILVGFKNKS